MLYDVFEVALFHIDSRTMSTRSLQNKFDTICSFFFAPEARDNNMTQYQVPGTRYLYTRVCPTGTTGSTYSGGMVLHSTYVPGTR